jgi:hypothetical protein
MRWLQQDSSQSPGKSEFQRTGALSFACFCCVGTAGLLLRGSLVAAKEANLYLTKVVCLRRNDWIDQPLRCNAASQIRASRSSEAVALLGYEVARNWLGTRADWLGASTSLLHTGGPDFHTEIDPPNEPAADLRSSASASRSARSAIRSQARAPGQPAPSSPPPCAFAAAIDRTWLLPEPSFLRSSALFLQVLEAQGGRPLFRSCGAACLLETRREGGGRFL